MYSFLADLVVAGHLGYVLFVFLGQIAIVIGVLLGWRWARNPGFRWTHLVMITIVAVQAVLGILCPLTTLENHLRATGNEIARLERGPEVVCMTLGLNAAPVAGSVGALPVSSDLYPPQNDLRVQTIRRLALEPDHVPGLAGLGLHGAIHRLLRTGSAHVLGSPAARLRSGLSTEAAAAVVPHCRHCLFLLRDSRSARMARVGISAGLSLSGHSGRLRFRTSSPSDKHRSRRHTGFDRLVGLHGILTCRSLPFAYCTQLDVCCAGARDLP